MEDFEFSLIVCTILVLAVMVSDMGQSIGPLFSVALLALSQAGYFFVHQFRKAGLPVLKGEIAFIGAVFLCYFATLVAGGALSLIVPLAFVPVLFCTPAFALIVRHFIS
jgi:fatty acid desaturase